MGPLQQSFDLDESLYTFDTVSSACIRQSWEIMDLRLGSLTVLFSWYGSIDIGSWDRRSWTLTESCGDKSYAGISTDRRLSKARVLRKPVSAKEKLEPDDSSSGHSLQVQPVRKRLPLQWPVRSQQASIHDTHVISSLLLSWKVLAFGLGYCSVTEVYHSLLGTNFVPLEFCSVRVY